MKDPVHHKATMKAVVSFVFGAVVVTATGAVVQGDGSGPAAKANEAMSEGAPPAAPGLQLIDAAGMVTSTSGTIGQRLISGPTAPFYVPER